MGIKQILKNRSSLRVDNNKVTNAANLTLRQSLWPLTIVTLLFFLWVSLQKRNLRLEVSSVRLTCLKRSQGFAYGLLDTLNKHFQNTLGITRTRSSGLQAAYFGYVPISQIYVFWFVHILN